MTIESNKTLAERDGAIWFNGELVDWREAKVHVLTHTLHYGVGVFEGDEHGEQAQNRNPTVPGRQSCSRRCS